MVLGPPEAQSAQSGAESAALGNASNERTRRAQLGVLAGAQGTHPRGCCAHSQRLRGASPQAMPAPSTAAQRRAGFSGLECIHRPTVVDVRAADAPRANLSGALSQRYAKIEGMLKGLRCRRFAKVSVCQDVFAMRCECVGTWPRQFNLRRACSRGVLTARRDAQHDDADSA